MPGWREFSLDRQSDGTVLIGLVEQVSIGIECHLYGAVAHPCLHALGAYPLLNPERGGGVAEVVKGIALGHHRLLILVERWLAVFHHRIADTGRNLDRSHDRQIHVAVAHYPFGDRGKHQLIVRGWAGQLPDLERGDGGRWQGNGSVARFGFRWTDHILEVGTLIDCHRRGAEVDAAPRQPAQF